MPSEIKLDLHDIFNRGEQIDRALNDAFAEARRIRAKTLQIIHGKGAGQLKKHVQRFCQRPDVKAVTRQLDNDSKNWGRLFLHFRWPEK